MGTWQSDAKNKNNHQFFSRRNQQHYLLLYYDTSPSFDPSTGVGTNFGGDGSGKPKWTSSSSSSYQPRNSSYNFHDPFSVFEEVFREEFGGCSNDGDDDDGFFSSKQKKSTTPGQDNDSNDDQDRPLPPGAKQIGMQTAMKTINGKSVTVTERVYQLPDGSVTKRVEKDIDNTKPSPSSSGSRPSKKGSSFSYDAEEPTGASTNSFQPRVTTRIVNGMKETTTVYPDGRSETKTEPVGSTKSPQTFTSTNKTSICNKKNKMKQPKQGKTCNDEVRVTTRIVNGVKEVTTEYPGGRSETKCEPIDGGVRRYSTTESSSVPTTTNNNSNKATIKNKNVTKNQEQPRQEQKHSQTRTATKIVNGMKETTIHHPDGRIETKIESVGSTSNPKSKTRMMKNVTSGRSHPLEKNDISSNSTMTMTSPFPSSPGGTGRTSTRQSIRIVNGKKETTIEYTTTRPDGSTETRTEKRVESC